MYTYLTADNSTLKMKCIFINPAFIIIQVCIYILGWQSIECQFQFTPRYGWVQSWPWNFLSLELNTTTSVEWEGRPTTCFSLLLQGLEMSPNLLLIQHNTNRGWGWGLQVPLPFAHLLHVDPLKLGKDRRVCFFVTSSILMRKSQLIAYDRKW